MSVYETLIQSARQWVATVMGWTDEEAATKVVPADRGPVKGSRPDLPFLMLNIVGFGRIVGTDERAYLSSGRRVKGERRGTLSFVGFGEETADWLTVLALNTDRAPDPLSVVEISQMNDVSVQLGTSIEYRFARDFPIAYGLLTDADPTGFTPATSVAGTVEDETGDQQDLFVDWS